MANLGAISTKLGRHRPHLGWFRPLSGETEQTSSLVSTTFGRSPTKSGADSIKIIANSINSGASSTSFTQLRPNLPAAALATCRAKMSMGQHFMTPRRGDRATDGAPIAKTALTSEKKPYVSLDLKHLLELGRFRAHTGPKSASAAPNLASILAYAWARVRPTRGPTVPPGIWRQLRRSLCSMLANIGPSSVTCSPACRSELLRKPGGDWARLDWNEANMAPSLVELDPSLPELRPASIGLGKIWPGVGQVCGTFG